MPFKLDRNGILVILVLVLVVVLVVAYYLNVRVQNEREALEQSPAAAALSVDDAAGYLDIDGNPVSLSDYVGTNVIAFAWASWCPSCEEQLRLLGSVAAENPEVVVLGINRAESAVTAKQYLAFFGLDETIDLILDPSDHFFKVVDGYAMPETVFFDSTGAVFHHERGALDREEVEYLVSEVQNSTVQ